MASVTLVDTGPPVPVDFVPCRYVRFAIGAYKPFGANDRHNGLQAMLNWPIVMVYAI